MSFLCLYAICIFPKNRGILLLNHSLVMKFRNFSIETVLLPILPSVFKCCQLSKQHPLIALFPFSTGSSPWSQSAFSYHACLVSCNQEQFLSLSFSLMKLTLLKNTGQFEKIGWSSFWGCLMSPPEQIQMACLWLVYDKNNSVSFSGYHTKSQGTRSPSDSHQ